MKGTTDEARVPLYAGMAVVAVVLAWGVVALTSKISWPQWLISPPSLAGTFAVVYALFDRVLWRTRLLHGAGIVKVADLSGIYDGSLVSTFVDADQRRVERAVTFTIKQTWTRICIEMDVRSETSSSMSTSALGAVRCEGDTAVLTYIYRNRVNPGVADADMGDHEGAAELRIKRDGGIAGRYFNSRPRAGTIYAQRRVA